MTQEVPRDCIEDGSTDRLAEHLVQLVMGYALLLPRDGLRRELVSKTIEQLQIVLDHDLKPLEKSDE